MFYSELVNRASEYAAICHRRQLRRSKKTPTPYIQHCFMVGYILEKAGFEDDVVAAGILHDVLEDTKSTQEDLRTNFGDRITELVNSVTEQDKSLAWEERKMRYLQRLEEVSDEAKAIATADKIHNISSMISALEEGIDVWSLFKRGERAQIMRFRKLLSLLQRKWNHPLVSELSNKIEALEKSSSTAGKY